LLRFRGASEHTCATPSGCYRNHNSPVISYNPEPDAGLRLNMVLKDIAGVLYTT
jgi:hypothetical protein